MSSRKPQFTLRDLFRFTTVAAVLLALFACTAHLFKDSKADACITVAFLLWPSIAGLVAWSCPGISYTVRVWVFVIVGAGVVALFWYRLWPSGGLGEGLLQVFVGTYVTLAFLWIPQALAVDAVTTYVRQWKSKQLSERAADTLHPQSDLPLGGSISVPLVK
jgi:hypothetical protein